MRLCFKIDLQNQIVLFNFFKWMFKKGKLYWNIQIIKNKFCVICTYCDKYFKNDYDTEESKTKVFSIGISFKEESIPILSFTFVNCIDNKVELISL